MAKELVNSEDPHMKQMIKFLNNLHEMLKDNMHTDFVIECDGQEFNVHKLVFTAASPYFGRMLESNFQESSSNRVKFPTIKKDMMELIIEFIYNSGKSLPTTWEVLLELFKTAHLLEIEILVEHCSDIISKNVNQENWCEIWEVSDLYQNNKMIDSVSAYLLQNLEKVLKTPEFLRLPLNKVMLIIEKINKQKKVATDFIFEGILKWIKQEHEREAYFGKLCSNFNHMELSFEFVNFLIDEEQLVKENSEVLLSLLKLQMEKEKFCNCSKRKSYTEQSDGGILCKQIIPNELNGGLLFQYLQTLPFQLTKGMACISNKHHIYFIGGEETSKDSIFQHNKNEASKGSKVFILYDIYTNNWSRFHPLLYAVYDPLCFIYKNELFVIGNDACNSNDSRMYIQNCKLGNPYSWEAIEADDTVANIKFILKTDNMIFSLH